MFIFETDEPPEDLEHPEGIQYREAWAYLQQKPDWLNHVLLLGVVQLLAEFVPIAGLMVLLGYYAEVLERLVRTRGRFHPKFDTNALGRYLDRGVVPFVVQMAVGFLLGMVFMIAMYAFMIATALSIGPRGPVRPMQLILPMVLFVCLVIVLSAAASVLLTPFVIRASLTKSMAETFRLEWIFDFFRRTLRHILLETIYMVVLGTGALVVALVTCGLGGPFIGAFLGMVQVHLWFQLYRIYLAEGGTPVPFPPASPAPLFETDASAPDAGLR